MFRTPAQPPVLPRRRESAPLVIEALGYLGGVVTLVAAFLIAAQYWPSLSPTARLIIVGSAAVLLLASGFALPNRLGGMGTRMRIVLWLLSTAAVAAFLGLLGGDLLDWTADDVVLLAGGGTALYAGTLWQVRRTLPQQLMLFVATCVAAGAAAVQLNGTDVEGLAVWGVGVSWLLLGWGGILPYRQVTMAAGAIGLIIGGGMTMQWDAGIALSVLSVLALVAVAVMFRDLLLLGVGALGALQVLPMAVTTWFPGRLAAPIALLVVGILLVVTAVLVARRRAGAEPPSSPRRDFSHGKPRNALAAIAVVAAAVIAVILSAGLT